MKILKQSRFWLSCAMALGLAGGTQMAHAQYCKPTTYSGSNAVIHAIKFNAIVYGGLTQNGGTPAFLNATTNLTAGNTYSLEVTSDPNTIASAWFDWNQDSVFSANEFTQLYTNGSTGQVGITVPAGQPQGIVRARLRSRSTSNANGASDACTPFGGGSSYDFNVSVGSCAAGHTPTAAIITNITAAGANMNFNTANTPYSVQPLPGGPINHVSGVPMQVSVSTSATATVSVWFDYNQNGVFEGTEWYQPYASGTSGSTMVQLPYGMPTGQYQMRIRSRAVGNPNGPYNACTYFSSGSGYDVTVDVTAPGAQASVTQACPTFPITLDLPTAPQFGSTNYSYTWEASADNVNFSVISSHGPASISVYASNPVTYYRARIHSPNNPTGSGPYTSVATVNSVPFQQCYCTPVMQRTNYDQIGRVVIGAFANPAAAPTQCTNVTTANAGYTDNTGMATINVARTVAYPLSVLTTSANYAALNDSAKAYIDWNQNGSFADAGEMVFAGYLYNCQPSASTFTVPTTATLGNTRMRIMLYDSYNVGPCGTSTDGETEDYTLNITNAPALAAEPMNAASATLLSTPTTTSLKASWTNGNGAARLVVMSTSPINATNLPIDGMAYTPSSAFGSTTSSSLNGAKVIYAGAGNQVIVTGLQPNTTYYAAAIEYNGTSLTNRNYLTTTFTTGSGNTLGMGTIATGNTSKVRFCAAISSTLQVPYTLTGAYAAANIFTAQLSDATGSFAMPTNIGTRTSNVAGAITATLPRRAARRQRLSHPRGGQQPCHHRHRKRQWHPGCARHDHDGRHVANQRLQHSAACLRQLPAHPHLHA